MGEIAEMKLDGTLCEHCGDYLNEIPPGYPCYCESCQEYLKQIDDSEEEEEDAKKDIRPKINPAD